MSRPRHRTAFTTAEVAHHIGVSKSTVVRWIEAGDLEAFRTPGGHRRVTRAALDAFCRGHGVPLVQPLSDRRSVLVVDDEPRVRAAIVQLLNLLDPSVPVLTAEDAFQAGQLFAEHQPAIVLLDLVLPGMNGFHFYDHLMREEGGPETAVVVITGDMRDHIETRARELGIQRFLHKPLTSAAITKILDEFLPRA